MATLYLFNPENDLALACGHRNYFPPRNALELRNSGAMLPLWYASAGDRVLTAALPDENWLRRVRDDFGIGAIPATSADSAVTCCSPWGWSPSVRSQLLRAGVGADLLPGERQIERIRELSHRRTTIAVLRELKKRGLYKGELPVELTDAGQLREMFANAGREGFYLKAPWSSSGRGVIPSNGIPVEALLTQAGGIIRHQGSAVVETGYARQRDFAMLFRKSAGEKVCFTGLSLFETAGRSYVGNRLMSDDEIRSTLARHVSLNELDAVADALQPILSDIIGEDYEGYFGVDMMTVSDDDGTSWIHPCVEINLRMTMGVVAHIFSRRYLAPGSGGYLTVASGETADRGAVVEIGRLVEGEVSLVPPGGRFSVTVHAGRI